MNCKPGDLAVIVNAQVLSNIGKILTVTRYERNVLMKDGSRMDGWRFEGPYLPGLFGGRANIVEDDALRPIRDNDGEDEILRIAGYPHKETA